KAAAAKKVKAADPNYGGPLHCDAKKIQAAAEAVAKDAQHLRTILQAQDVTVHFYAGCNLQPFSGRVVRVEILGNTVKLLKIEDSKGSRITVDESSIDQIHSVHGGVLYLGPSLGTSATAPTQLRPIVPKIDAETEKETEARFAKQDAVRGRALIHFVPGGTLSSVIGSITAVRWLNGNLSYIMLDHRQKIDASIIRSIISTDTGKHVWPFPS
ncbi:hypothetical protein LCGC14_1609540, partial [marine sediment metagenome]